MNKFNPRYLLLGIIPTIFLTQACMLFNQGDPEVTQVREVRITTTWEQNKWQAQPGSDIKGAQVIGGLGDISLDLSRKSIIAPFNGDTFRNRLDKNKSCIYFSSVELPGFIIRICNAKEVKLGKVKKGEFIGKGDEVSFALLMQEEKIGTYSIVQPDKELLDKMIN